MTHDLPQDVNLLTRRFKHRMRVICVSSANIDDLRCVFLAGFFVDAPSDHGRDSPGRQTTVKRAETTQTPMPFPQIKFARILVQFILNNLRFPATIARYFVVYWHFPSEKHR
jgi:hypothetical protein